MRDVLGMKHCGDHRCEQNGQYRGGDGEPRCSHQPAFSRSTAMAPITALSVQSRKRGDVQFDLPAVGLLLQAAARSRALAATPPPTHKICMPVCSQRRNCLAHQAIDHRLLKAGGQVGRPAGQVQGWMLAVGSGSAPPATARSRSGRPSSAR